MRRVQRFLWVAILIGLLTGGGSLFLLSAHAQTPQAHRAASPSCSGNGCNGRDPYATGCAGGWASWGVVDSVPVYNWQRAKVGYLQLWYSWTCGTNWSRFLCTARALPCPFIEDLGLFAESSPGCQCGEEVQFVRDVSVTDVRTKQEYLPTTRAEADIMIDCLDRACLGASTHWE